MQDLTKEDLKMMAKQIEKAKRDQNAKQAITTFGEPTMPSSVSFDAPVKVLHANIIRFLLPIIFFL